ncbi:MAG: hypothetical protein WDM71_11345 [Ferruginibacter sp.]
MNKYKHIFFDLDHTLWDFNTNAKEALQDIYALFALKQRASNHSKNFTNNTFITTKYCGIVITKDLSPAKN